MKRTLLQHTYFFAGTVFCRFHSFNMWSSEAVISTGSTGWKTRARMPSKWLQPETNNICKWGGSRHIMTTTSSAMTLSTQTVKRLGTKHTSTHLKHIFRVLVQVLARVLQVLVIGSNIPGQFLLPNKIDSLQTVFDTYKIPSAFNEFHSRIIQDG